MVFGITTKKSSYGKNLADLVSVGEKLHAAFYGEPESAKNRSMSGVDARPG
jgi:hypothetical protein